MKRSYLITSLLLFSAASGIAQAQVTDYRPGVTEDGITYFLPDTYVRVVVTATKTHHTPGEFCQYAERYLRLKNVAQSAYDEWEIKGISLETFGVANSTKAYTVKLKPKTSAPFVGLASDGRLLSINADAPQETAKSEPGVVKINSNTADPASFKTQEILNAGSTAKMAELTANEIYDIRENRGLLSKGQADFMPKDGEQLRLMLANLDTQEDGLMHLFTGTTTSETHTIVYDVCPSADAQNTLLFRFSKYLGVVSNDDPAGIPVYISFKDQKTVPETVADPKAKPRKEAEDIRYAVPSRVAVRVYTDAKEYATQSFPMTQFGKVEHLGSELFNKKNTTRVTFYPETGGIAKLEGDLQ